MPLYVRLYYINEYYNIAKQAYKKQYLDYRDEVRKFAVLLARSSNRVDKKYLNKIKNDNVGLNAPIFRSQI